MGLPMGSGTDAISAQAFETGEGVVGNEEAAKQVVPAGSRKITHKLDWTDIFERFPELYPPGYNEAVEATRLKMEQRRMAAKARTEKPPATKKTSTRRRKR